MDSLESLLGQLNDRVARPARATGQSQQRRSFIHPYHSNSSASEVSFTSNPEGSNLHFSEAMEDNMLDVFGWLIRGAPCEAS
jgi:hypothetical protein